MRRSQTMSVQSSGRESRICWKSSASATRGDYLGEEDLLEQEHVEGDDQAPQDAREEGQPAWIDHRPHHVPLPTEKEQWDQRERDAEGEDDLADHERVGWVDAQPQDHGAGASVIARRRK